MQWQLLLEEYHLKVVHNKRINNDAADAFSRLDLTDKSNDLRVWDEKIKR